MIEVKRRKIGDICIIEKGVTGLAKAKPGNYPLVTTGAGRKTSTDYQFNAKAVCIPLVSSTGHGKKSLNYVHYQEGKFALGSILAAIIPKDDKELNTRYLHAYLQKNKDRIIVPLMKGAANVSLSVKAISGIEIPLPKIEKQDMVLKKIDGISSEYGDFLKEADVQTNLFGQLRQAVLEEAIKGKLTAEWRKQNPELISEENHASKLLEKIRAEKDRLNKHGEVRKGKPFPPITEDEKSFVLPQGWTWCRLGEICSKIGSGSTPKGSNYSLKGIPFFRSQNIHDEGLVYDDIKFISIDVHEQMKGTVVIAGDLLLNITGGSLGRCALVPREFNEGNVSQHVCIIRGVLVCEAFMHKIILSPLFQKMVFESTTGAGREGLPKYNLEQFVVPIPPFDEQQVIAKSVDNLVGIIGELEKQVSARKEQSEMLMRSVLQEAFAG